MLDLASLDAFQCVKHRGHEWEKDPAHGSSERGQRPRQREYGQVVLAFKLPIHGHERIDLLVRAPQQLAVLDAGSTEPLHGEHIVTCYLRDQVVWQVLVKQNAH